MRTIELLVRFTATVEDNNLPRNVDPDSLYVELPLASCFITDIQGTVIPSKICEVETLSVNEIS